MMMMMMRRRRRRRRRELEVSWAGERVALAGWIHSELFDKSI
jgi:hypothetical protein